MSHARALRLSVGPLTALSVLALGVSPAFGAGSEGLWGEVDDRVITYWAFAVMAFFAILVIGLSLLQGRAESRREREQAELERLRRD